MPSGFLDTDDADGDEGASPVAEDGSCTWNWEYTVLDVSRGARKKERIKCTLGPTCASIARWI